ncbi:MAG: phenylalanine--tRNA ligase subunit alpha [Alphaproteobacteria bacterium]|jgi:phenylalanyl-tRNA synthetase alpha chain|nr:phenylalanine--tRNA ligase subunit alpha [Alphaproteobacteria bacterium]MCV6599914.1 phenylalanine--tRNA ligase subunit alpha [Alphaproteobacteria bacterium]
MELEQLKEELINEVSAIDTPEKLEEARVKILGKKGVLTTQMKSLGGMSPEERKVAGPLLNSTKVEITNLIEEKVTAFKAEQMNKRLETEKVDVTLSARPKAEGKVHPISQTIDELTAILGDMGFSVAEGPDVETIFNNFDALNTPKYHPAREATDTFYMPEKDGQKRVLRTQTSAVQIRTMTSQELPIKIICPGKTYRNDSDATHSPMFHQLEALIVEEKGKITMANLKWTIEEMFAKFFELDEMPMRLRPHCFPFTEPSAEVDISYSKDSGNIKIGKGENWLEVAGCGMVHPKVLENCGIDSSKYQGFAFGFGIDRLAMLKYGMPDIRSFFEADARWISHYGFSFCSEPNLVMGKK